MPPTRKPIARSENIIMQELENEILIYDLIINKAFCLNETLSLVWQLSDGSKSVSEISDLMSKNLKTKVSEDFIWLTLEELKKNNLLENADELTNHFVGLSRREIIKRVGLASMVMLPMITSIVAPSAAMAQSGGIGLLGACPSGSGCDSGLACVPCSGGSCSGALTCCSNIHPVAGPGAVSGCTFDPSDCFFISRSSCCSGGDGGYINGCCICT